LTVALATVAHDPRNRLLGKLGALLPPLAEVFDGIGVLASASATSESVAMFEASGALVDREPLPDGTDTIGRRRRGCLEVALRTGASHVVYSDIDHVMRWLEREPDSLRDALEVLPRADFTVFGRPPHVFAEAPLPLRETEGLCNRYYERLTGRPWDLFIAIRGMSAATAALIVEGCDEDTIATDVAWPLFVESRGCTVAYREVPIQYENHRWYARGVSEREQMENDPRQWSLRFHLGQQMFDAFARWGPSPSA
jgi:hypothetical protein